MKSILRARRLTWTRELLVSKAKLLTAEYIITEGNDRLFSLTWDRTHTLGKYISITGAKGAAQLHANKLVRQIAIIVDESDANKPYIPLE